jgi:hypothetical protein
MERLRALEQWDSILAEHDDVNERLSRILIMQSIGELGGRAERLRLSEQRDQLLEALNALERGDIAPPEQPKPIPSSAPAGGNDPEASDGRVGGVELELPDSELRSSPPTTHPPRAPLSPAVDHPGSRLRAAIDALRRGLAEGTPQSSPTTSRSVSPSGVLRACAGTPPLGPLNTSGAAVPSSLSLVPAASSDSGAAAASSTATATGTGGARQQQHASGPRNQRPQLGSKQQQQQRSRIGVARLPASVRRAVDTLTRGGNALSSEALAVEGVARAAPTVRKPMMLTLRTDDDDAAERERRRESRAATSSPHAVVRTGGRGATTAPRHHFHRHHSGGGDDGRQYASPATPPASVGEAGDSSGGSLCNTSADSPGVLVSPSTDSALGRGQQQPPPRQKYHAAHRLHTKALKSPTPMSPHVGPLGSEPSNDPPARGGTSSSSSTVRLTRSDLDFPAPYPDDDSANSNGDHSADRGSDCVKHRPLTTISEAD